MKINPISKPFIRVFKDPKSGKIMMKIKDKGSNKFRMVEIPPNKKYNKEEE